MMDALYAVRLLEDGDVGPLLECPFPNFFLGHRLTSIEGIRKFCCIAKPKRSTCAVKIALVVASKPFRFMSKMVQILLPFELCDPLLKTAAGDIPSAVRAQETRLLHKNRSKKKLSQPWGCDGVPSGGDGPWATNLVRQGLGPASRASCVVGRPHQVCAVRITGFLDSLFEPNNDLCALRSRDAACTAIHMPKEDTSRNPVLKRRRKQFNRRPEQKAKYSFSHNISL